MSKTIKIILGVVVLLAVAGGGLWLFTTYQKTPGVEPGDRVAPFGEGEEGDFEFREGEEGYIPPSMVDSFLAPPRLVQLHQTPTAGAVSFENEGGNTMARYIERGVGHIFETNMSTSKETRISNQTRLKIYEALWRDNGQSVVTRYLDDQNQAIRSFLIKLYDSEMGESQD